MHSTSSAARRRYATPCRGFAQLRREYFAHAGVVANRYGITFDRVVAHLWHARRSHRHLPLRAVRHLDDVVHSAACIDQVSLAWSDMIEQYERPLVRRCRIQLDETASIIMVRRLFADLRRRSVEHDAPALPSLRCYRGVHPLRTWLTDRLVGMLARELLIGGTLPGRSAVSVTRRPLDTAATRSRLLTQRAR